MSYKDASYINWRSWTVQRLPGLPAACQRARNTALQPGLENSHCCRIAPLQEFHRWVHRTAARAHRSIVSPRAAARRVTQRVDRASHGSDSASHRLVLLGRVAAEPLAVASRSWTPSTRRS